MAARLFFAHLLLFALEAWGSLAFPMLERCISAIEILRAQIDSQVSPIADHGK
jgi:hypothetical protein